VELSLNGSTIGKSIEPKDGYVYAFPDVPFATGTLKAVGLCAGKSACTHELTTAGKPARIKLTPITAPGGLKADGADVALADVEVTDTAGNRCPTDEARIDFTVTGPANWRGGYNSGIINSTNNLYLSTECGINRIAIRSTTDPGDIKLTATRPGLEPGTVTIPSNALPAATADGVASMQRLGT
jgi:beta-galactosidase